MIKIATWNVNSVRARLPNVIDWLQDFSPDIVLLQETKCQEEQFPFDDIESLGYNVAVRGQKTYNGVAILSKMPFDEVIKELPGDDEDSEARYIEAVIDGVRVASVYVPNGSEIGSPKFAFKMRFYDRLYDHLKQLLKYEEQMVIGGDYNVAPEEIDTYDSKKAEGKLLFSIDERSALRKLFHLGLTDGYRAKHPKTGHYSWWNYRAGSWQKNHGFRIDHLLLSPQASDVLVTSDIDAKPRGNEKASDHTPVWCELNRIG
jgi:exodeoxyribonuclease III